MNVVLGILLEQSLQELQQVVYHFILRFGLRIVFRQHLLELFIMKHQFTHQGGIADTTIQNPQHLEAEGGILVEALYELADVLAHLFEVSEIINAILPQAFVQQSHGCLSYLSRVMGKCVVH